MKKLILFCALCLPTLLIGCQAAPFIIGPAVTGVIIWKEGEAHKYYHEEPQTLFRATKLALKDLGHPIRKEEASRDGGYYITAGEKDRFKIVIRNVQPKITEVKVRINFMGDKPYAELLYKGIDGNTDTIDFDEQGLPTKRKLNLRHSQ